MKSKNCKMLCLFMWKALLILSIFPLWGNPEDLLQEAPASYQEGEKATTYNERKLAFNRALFLYSTLEQQTETLYTASLDQALADTYFQLEEYAWAILYYQRALKKCSNCSLLSSHLKEAQKKLGLPSVSENQAGQFQIFFIQQFRFLFWILIITFLIFSCMIWFSISWVRQLAVAFTLLSFLLLANIFFSYYFTPLEGILVKTTGFYRAPDQKQPQLTKQPLLAGSKVQILQITTDKDWLKVKNSEGLIGYIPVSNLRPI